MTDKNVYAAIALALHEYAGEGRHDRVSGVITIREHPTQWNSYSLAMTEMPVKS